MLLGIQYIEQALQQELMAQKVASGDRGDALLGSLSVARHSMLSLGLPVGQLCTRVPAFVLGAGTEEDGKQDWRQG